MSYENLLKTQEWLINDQYEHGEWGKNESKNPTDEPRTFEFSRLKPNLFSSSQALYALIATGAMDKTFAEKFFDWLHKLRDGNGYWTSASGSNIPFGTARGWSEVINIRNTAKALDILMLMNEFVSSDVENFYYVINSQLDSGAFPQIVGGSGEIWSTAYVMNLIIRALQPKNILKTRPRNKRNDEWASELQNYLGKARAWIYSQRNSDGLWEISQREPIWVTQAVLSEIGGDTVYCRPDLCPLLAEHLLNGYLGRNSITLWSLLMLFPKLTSSQQKDVLNSIKKLVEKPITDFEDILEASCYCKLLWLSEDTSILTYYMTVTNGHESCLLDFSPWGVNDYQKWCINIINDKIKKGEVNFIESPTSKADAWITMLNLLFEFKHQVEKSRGWELLWKDKETPRHENEVQVSFWNIAQPLAKSKGCTVIREPETGRGPVDFEFRNGFNSRIYIEFKLASNSRYMDGLDKQLIEYMSAQKIDSAIFVVIGFVAGDEEKYKKVQARVREIMENNKNVFLDTVYVDASRKAGASTGKSK